MDGLRYLLILLLVASSRAIDDACTSNSSLSNADIFIVFENTAFVAHQWKEMKTLLSTWVAVHTLAGAARDEHYARMQFIGFGNQATAYGTFADLNSTDDVHEFLYNDLKHHKDEIADIALGLNLVLDTPRTLARPSAVLIFSAGYRPGISSNPAEELKEIKKWARVVTVGMGVSESSRFWFIVLFWNDTAALSVLDTYASPGFSARLSRGLDLATMTTQAVCYCAWGARQFAREDGTLTTTCVGELSTGTPSHARATCSQDGWTSLVTEASAHKKRFLNEVFTGSQNTLILSLQLFAGGWYWDSEKKQPLSGFRDWAVGYPFGSDACAISHQDSRGNFHWENMACDVESVVSYMCERPACSPDNICPFGIRQ